MEKEDDPAPGKVRWLISCDESGIHGSRLYGFGTLWMKWQRRGDFVAGIRAIKEKHGHEGEIKWKKCHAKKYETFHLEIIRYFFERPWLAFHCLMVEKKSVDLGFHDHDWDLARRKHLCMLVSDKIKRSIRRHAGREQEYRLWIDPIASRYAKADEELHVITNNVIAKELGGIKTLESVVSRDSKDVYSIQICDLILGAILSAWQGETTSDVKVRLRKEIAKYLGWDDLSWDTHVKERKFNIWYFYDPTRGPRIVETKLVKLNVAI